MVATDVMVFVGVNDRSQFGGARRDPGAADAGAGAVRTAIRPAQAMADSVPPTVGEREEGAAPGVRSVRCNVHMATQKPIVVRN